MFGARLFFIAGLLIGYLIRPGGVLAEGTPERFVVSQTADVIELGDVHPEGAVVYGDYLYVVHFSRRSPAKVSKVHLPSFTLVDILTVNKSGLETVEVDGAFLYIGTMATGKLIRVNLQTFTEDGEYILPINAVAGMHRIGVSLYAAAFDAPVGVVKIHTRNASTPIMLKFPSGEDQAEEMDDDGTYLYVPL